MKSQCSNDGLRGILELPKVTNSCRSQTLPFFDVDEVADQNDEGN